eukprot:scaffold8451_cov128-Isochrysis_galbana.AAC.4
MSPNATSTQKQMRYDSPVKTHLRLTPVIVKAVAARPQAGARYQLPPTDAQAQGVRGEVNLPQRLHCLPVPPAGGACRKLPVGCSRCRR